MHIIHQNAPSAFEVQKYFHWKILELNFSVTNTGRPTRWSIQPPIRQTNSVVNSATYSTNELGIQFGVQLGVQTSAQPVNRLFTKQANQKF